MLSSSKIRRDFIEFFEGKGHTFVSSSPVVPIGDDTLLFTNAGMNQFKDIFLGIKSSDYPRAVNSQKCIRAGGKHNDLEEVGVDTYHHTFFEMLGNWSFGDYFKSEAIDWAWELMTEVWGLDKDRFYATYFEGDEALGVGADSEAKDFWLRYLPDDHVLGGNRKDNFWEMGDTGPCGPCSELHYDGRSDSERSKTAGRDVVNKDNPDVIEIWNLVFIQYNNDGVKLSELPARHVDTGMGFERIVRLLQGKSSNYDTDVFSKIMEAVGELCGKQYGGKLEDQNDIAFRVIADHIRTLAFAVTDGATPSNDGRGYVLRRILRRASRFGRVLGMHEPFMYKLVDVVAEDMGGAFGELRDRSEFVRTVIKAEEESFNRTLDRGLEIFSGAADKAEKSGEKQISGEEAFSLYDTYGFPLDLTRLMARERGLGVDEDGFENLMEEQRERARAAQKSTEFTAGLSGADLGVTDDSSKYVSDSCIANVVGWVDKGGFHDTGKFSEAGIDAGLVLDTTCFYAESGGQVGDKGMIVTSSGKFSVETTEKIADCVVHKGKLIEGEIAAGEEGEARVDKERKQSRKNHTATHLLQLGLQRVLGESVHQQGSLVCPEYLRFDFTWPKALSEEQVSEVEQLVREKIEADLPIYCTVKDIEEAKKLGAMALFGEKYGSEVRVVAIGSTGEDSLDKAISREFCGGTHVERTGEIEGFKIIREESVSAGVRRITAMTGKALMDYLLGCSDVVDSLCGVLKCPSDQLLMRVSKLMEDNKKLSKQLKSGVRGGGADAVSQAGSLLDNAEKAGDTYVIVGELDSGVVEQGRRAIDSLRKKARSAAIVLGLGGSEGKAILLAAMTDDVIGKGLKAGEVVRQIAPIVGGGGGGRDQMAQAGGKDADKIPEALAKAREIIKDKLG